MIKLRKESKEETPICKKIIILDDIKPNRELLPEAVGVTSTELKNCIKQIFDKWPDETLRNSMLLKTLGLNKREITQTAEKLEIIRKFQMVKALVDLWKKRSRKKITLLECVGTIMLLWTEVQALRKKKLEEGTRKRVQTTTLKISSDFD